MDPIEYYNSLPDGVKDSVRKAIVDASIKTAKSGLGKLTDLSKRKDFFGLSKRKYKDYVMDTLSMMRILDMNQSVKLSNIFIPPTLADASYRFLYHDDKSSDSYGYGRRLYRGERDEKLYSIHEALEVCASRLVVLGDPGAGKSTLLKCITLSAFDEDAQLSSVSIGKFPIYIELRRYSESNQKRDKGLLEYFFEVYEADDTDRQMFEAMLFAGDVVLLLDALDEVSSSQRQVVIREIERLSYKYKDCCFIVSSRVGDYKDNLGNFSAFDINEFTSKDKGYFVRKWFAVTNRLDLTDDLLQIVSTSEGIGEITTNPLLMSLVCLLYSRDLKLPGARAEVYQRCIEVLVREWDTKRQFRRDSAFENLSDNNKIAILSEIAHHYYMNRRRYFRKTSLNDFVASLLPKYGLSPDSSRDVIEEICSHHGIIVNVGANKIGFSHLTFQEYLTAVWYISRLKIKDLSELINIIPNSREVYILSSGMLHESSALLDSIRNSSALSPSNKLSVISSIISSGQSIFESDYTRGLNRHILLIIESLCASARVSKMNTKTLEDFLKENAPTRTGDTLVGFSMTFPSSENLETFLDITSYVFALKMWQYYEYDRTYLSHSESKSKLEFLETFLRKDYFLTSGKANAGRTVKLIFTK